MGERVRERERGLRGGRPVGGRACSFFAFACIFARCGVFPAMEVQLLDLPLVRPGMPPVEMPPVGGGIMNGFFGEIFDFEEPPPDDNGVPFFRVRGCFHVNTGSFSRKRISTRIPFVSWLYSKT